ncbi:MAG: hypothetical protein L0Y58_00705 [Verrucomicrobia subdivision 3 bacterium]|nr:hypothetical protein [Limisphaerales bacterium]
MAAKAVLLSCVLAGVAGFSRVADAAGPTNDFCSGAVVIPPAGPFPYFTVPRDIEEATNTVGEPIAACQEFIARSIWYSFTPSANAAYTITTCTDAGTATTVADTVLALYRSSGGCAGVFTSEECNDDFCGFQSSITRQLFADTTYYIVVWQYYDPLDPPLEAGLVQLAVTRFVRPPNDTCATAVQLAMGMPQIGSTLGAQDDYQLPATNACFSGVGQVESIAAGRDVVYSFKAPRDGEYSVRVYGYTGQSNLVLYVAGSCPSNGTPATVMDCLGAANRSSRSTAEEVVCVALASNQVVFIFVDDHSLTLGSTFRLEVNPCYREHEPNNSPDVSGPFGCGIQGAVISSDIDFFFLGSPPAGARAFVILDGEAANSTDFDLRITTDTDTLEYDESDNDFAFGSFAPNVAGTPLPGGPVYARVDFRGTASSEPYHLYAIVQPPASAAALESEPNGTIDNPNDSAINYFRGTLAEPSPSADVDVFRFIADEGDLLFVSVDGDPLRDLTPIDTRLELLDGTGNVLIAVDNNNAASTGDTGAGNLSAPTPSSPADALVYRVQDEGLYHVRVSISPGTTGSAGAGDYLLSISRNCYALPATLHSIMRATNGAVTVLMRGTPGALYHLEYSADLKTWTPYPSVPANAAGAIQFQDPGAADAPQRFYRAVSP